MTMHVLDQSRRRKSTTGYRAFLLREARALRAAEEGTDTPSEPVIDVLKRQPFALADGPRRTRAFMRISRGHLA